MDAEKLKYATELQKLITQTAAALTEARSWLDNPTELSGSVFSERAGHYALHFSEYSDRSGKHIGLCRYAGNSEVLKAVEQVLSEQLERYTKEFEEL